MSPPFFEVDGYDGIEDEMTQVFDATDECPKKDLDQHKLAQDFNKKVDVLTEEISGDTPASFPFYGAILLRQ